MFALTLLDYKAPSEVLSVYMCVSSFSHLDETDALEDTYLVLSAAGVSCRCSDIIG